MSGEEGGEGEDMIVVEEGNERRESERLRSGRGVQYAELS